MYPYFKKYTGDLQAAEQPAAVPGDRLRNFLEANPEYGTLQFQVTGGQGAFPIIGANVVITRDLDATHSFSVTTQTDSSGRTEPMSLPAPSRSLSQSPGRKDVFAVYRAVITAPDYVTVVVRDIPVFDGIATIQPVSMTASIGNQQQAPAEEIEDKEPDL